MVFLSLSCTFTEVQYLNLKCYGYKASIGQFIQSCKVIKKGNQPILHFDTGWYFDISVGVHTDMFSFDQHRAKVAHV